MQIYLIQQNTERNLIKHFKHMWSYLRLQDTLTELVFQLEAAGYLNQTCFPVSGETLNIKTITDIKWF